MTADSTLMIALIVTAFAVALVFALHQWRKARSAREQHKQRPIGDIRDAPPAPRARGERIDQSPTR